MRCKADVLWPAYILLSSQPSQSADFSGAKMRRAAADSGIQCLHQAMKRSSSLLSQYITKQDIRYHGDDVYCSDYCGAHVAGAKLSSSTAADASYVVEMETTPTNV